MESWIQLFLKLVSFQLCSPNNFFLSSHNSKTNERPSHPTPCPQCLILFHSNSDNFCLNATHNGDLTSLQRVARLLAAGESVLAEMRPKAVIQFSARLTSCCVTLSKRLSISEPQLITCGMGSLAVLIWRTVRSQGEHTCEVLGPCCAWHRSWGVGILPRKWMNKYRFHTSERPSCPQEGLAPELCGEPGTIATALTCTAQVLPGRCSHPSWRLSVVMVMEAHAVLGCQSPGPVLGRQACVVCVRMCTSV